MSSSSSSPCHRLQLSLRARRLPNTAKGLLRKSDPFAVVLSLGAHPELGGSPQILGRTEVIPGDLDPSWTTVFIVDDFRFGSPRYVEVGVFDYDCGRTGRKSAGAEELDGAVLDRNDLRLSRSDDTEVSSSTESFTASGRGGRQKRNGGSAGPESIDDAILRSVSLSSSGHAALRSLQSDHVCMGTAVFELGDILGTRGNVRCKALRPADGGGGGSSAGPGILYAQVTKSTHEEDIGSIYFQIRGMHLKNTHADLLNRRSSPFYEMYRREDRPQGAEWNSIYRSPTIRENLNPYWDAAELDLEKFCVDGDLNRSMKVAVYDRRRSGRHKFMGELETTVDRFLKSKGRTGSDLDSAFILRRDGKKVGSIVIVEAMIHKPERGEGVQNGEADSSASSPSVMHSASPDENGLASSHGGAAPGSADARRRILQSVGRQDHHGRMIGEDGSGQMAAVSGSEHSSAPAYSHHSSSGDEADAVAGQMAQTSLVEGPSAGRQVPQSSHSAQPQSQQPRLRPQQPDWQPAAQHYPVAHIPNHHRARRRQPEFVDYLTSGTEISLSVAIDFTSSNGNPRVPGTPHHVSSDPSTLNDYERAISTVGSLLAKYDSDKMFPVWGFGAKIDGQVRHCFQCGPHREVKGVEGMLEAYRGMFRSALVMSHPTVFTEVIRAAAADASHRLALARGENRLSYSLLLLLTAGNVSDVPATQRALTKAGASPLSVVIVGIGDANFNGMRFLDEFGESGGSARDITQFVKFNDFLPGAQRGSSTSSASASTGAVIGTAEEEWRRRRDAALSEAVLEEIPDQLVEYFVGRGLLPEAGVQHLYNASRADEDEGIIPVQPPDRVPSQFLRFYLPL